MLEAKELEKQRIKQLKKEEHARKLEEEKAAFHLNMTPKEASMMEKDTRYKKVYQKIEKICIKIEKSAIPKSQRKKDQEDNELVEVEEEQDGEEACDLDKQR